MFYLDLQEMLANHRLDIVSICTPPHVRLELLRTVMERSEARLLFLEKPVAATTGEAEAIRSLAKRHGCTVVVNLSRRWSPGAVRIREAVRSGRFGRLKTIHLRYTRGISNTGAHLFDLVRFTAGSIEQVQVLRRVPTSLDERGDGTYSFTFTLDGGAVTGYAEGFDDRDFTLFEMDLYLERGRIELRSGGEDIRYYGTEPHPVQRELNHLVLLDPEPELAGPQSNMERAVQHLVDVLRVGTPPVSTLEDGLFPLRAADALLWSSHNSGSLAQV